MIGVGDAIREAGKDIQTFLDAIKRVVDEAKEQTKDKDEFLLICKSKLNVSYEDIFMKTYWRRK